MKIGIFGDSFCNKNRLNAPTPEIWYNFLQAEYGHDVDCFGEAGSSILFSAELIRQRAADYDLVIWCATTPGRFCFPASAEHTVWQSTAYHVTSNSDVCNVKDVDLANKHRAAVDYLKYIFEWPQESFVGQAIVSYLQTLFSNIMVIPCFPSPLEAKFNLYDLSQQEIDFYFPGKDCSEIFRNCYDMRIGHLTLDHHKILAQLVNNDLKPGIFQTSYDNFADPTIPYDDIFKPLSFILPPLP
jgi:hypothetical protein